MKPPIRVVQGAIARGMLGAVAAQLDLAQRPIVMFGREVMQPRLTALLGEGTYTYSGKTMVAQPWTPLLEALRKGVEAKTRSSFNVCLANYYRDGKDSIGWHSDAEPELDPTAPIVSLSFGVARPLLVRPKGLKAPSSPSYFCFPLDDGDLCVMAPGMQDAWEHSIPKATAAVGPRLSLTFRRLRT